MLVLVFKNFTAAAMYSAVFSDFGAKSFFFFYFINIIKSNYYYYSVFVPSALVQSMPLVCSPLFYLRATREHPLERRAERVRQYSVPVVARRWRHLRV